MTSKYLQSPNEEQREEARKAVNCTADSVKRDVQVLMEWLEKQPHLPNFKDEDILSACLLHCKNSLEKTKQRLETYYNIRAIMPEVFSNRNLFGKELELQKNLSMYVPLRKLTPDGYRVVMFYLAEETETSRYIDKYSMDDFFKICQMTIELLGKYDYSKGAIVVHDFKNVTMALTVSFSSHLRKLILLGQKAIPVRYKKLYNCNVSKANEILITISKTMLKKELAERIEILKNPTDLCKVLPKEIIPRDYGGDELPLKELKDLWFEEMRRHSDFLTSLEKVCTDLSKLPKDFVTTELSGVTGSFRNISVD